MKWLVVWIAVMTSQGACHDPAPIINEYSGEAIPVMEAYAVACFDSHEKPMKKTFSSEEEAQAFVRTAPKCDEYPGVIQGVCIKNVEIKELL